MEGLNEVNAQYQKEYGPGDYVPNVFIQYWSMRVMAYLAALVLLLALWGAWAIWRRRLERSRWFLAVAPWAVIAPFIMNTAGWLLTENGRQPWIVQGLMLTKAGVSTLSLVVGRHHPGRVRAWCTACSASSTGCSWSATGAGTCPRARTGRRWPPPPGPAGRCRPPTSPVLTY